MKGNGGRKVGDNGRRLVAGEQQHRLTTEQAGQRARGALLVVTELGDAGGKVGKTLQQKTGTFEAR